MSQPHFSTANPYPLTGDVLDGKYRIERLLGEGGMGAVAKATHLLRRAPVALKFMSPAVMAVGGAVERFVNEGVAASQIDSDHVVKVFDVGRMPSGAPYLVMEYLEGCDLAQLMARDGNAIEPRRAVHFTLQMLRALQTAHAAGIIHRDMKPSNCFVIEKDGEPDFVKLVDFGISKVRTDDAEGRSPQLTRTNSALGTPLYMSPEQARSPRDVDHRTDLYSVGAILYEMLSTRTPYTAESGEYTEILFKIFTTEPEPLRGVRPDLPEPLCAVVHRALARDRDVRYGSAQEMADALAPFADDRSAQVLARLRGARGSRLPAQHFSVPAPAGPMLPATAQSVARGGESGRPPHVATDVGVTREASGTAATAGASKPGRAVLALLGVVALGLAGTAVGVVLLRSRPTALPAATHEPAATVVPEAPAAPPSAQTPATALAPLPSTAALSSAVVTPPPRPSGAPSASTPPKPSGPLPQTLGGLQLH
jgi:serine/threonine-protein kinase